MTRTQAGLRAPAHDLPDFPVPVESIVIEVRNEIAQPSATLRNGVAQQ